MAVSEPRAARPGPVVLRVDVGAVAPAGCATVAAEVFPAASPAAPVVLFCFPGGGMSRRYFDLPLPGYSFAAHLSARGFTVVTVDHPGVGDSDTPDDGWALTPETVAQVDAAAVAAIVADLTAGRVEGVPAGEPDRVVGVGHSAGALLTVRQQAAHRPYDALALLGWSDAGLPQFLEPEERDLGADPERLRKAQVDIARRRHGEPLVTLGRASTPRMTKGRLAPEVKAALGAAASPLLTVVGFASIVPGNSSREAAAVDVPVFVGVGERDLATDHHAIPAQLPASPDVTLFVLAGAGHNHNAEPNRAVLWDRLAAWLATLGPTRPVRERRGSSGP